MRHWIEWLLVDLLWFGMIERPFGSVNCMLWYEMMLYVICAGRFGGGSRFENGKC